MPGIKENTKFKTLKSKPLILNPGLHRVWDEVALDSRFRGNDKRASGADAAMKNAGKHQANEAKNVGNGC